MGESGHSKVKPLSRLISVAVMPRGPCGRRRMEGCDMEEWWERTDEGAVGGGMCHTTVSGGRHPNEAQERSGFLHSPSPAKVRECAREGKQDKHHHPCLALVKE